MALSSVSDTISTSVAFSPGHVTGIFAPAVTEESGILCQGSTGAGFSISKGITTTVKAFESKRKGYSVSINGERVHRTPVSAYVAEYFLRIVNYPVFLQVNHITEIPIGYGLGSSGAGALSLSYALNDCLKTGLSKMEAAQTAHCADLECKTGLGTVAALYEGGYEIRLKAGAPGNGITLRKDLDGYVASILCISPSPTREILGDPSNPAIDRNRCPIGLLGRLESMDDIGGFLDASFGYANDLGLTNGICRGPIKALKSQGIKCSVALFGETVFTIVPLERAKEARLCLNQFEGIFIEAAIDSMGARLMCECEFAN